MNTDAVKTLNLSKYISPTFSIENLNLSVSEGEILTLVGPSGCGKTTTLRLIAGFERPDSGQIIIGGRSVSDSKKHVPPEKRGVGMVFQDYALFPHLTVLENVSFGLPSKRNGRHKHIDPMNMIRLVGLEALASRYPHELSGGESQRVALARALAPKPILILLDEPFSNLDADLRSQMREEVRVILKGIKATAIFVTHDQEEALYIGDRLAVLHSGKLEQVGVPEDVFQNPATRFVAEFMGDTDFLLGTVKKDGIETEIGFLPQPVDQPIGTQVEVAIRPDDIDFEPSQGSDSMILARHFRGAFNIYRLRLPSGRLLHAYESHQKIYKPGTPVRISIQPGHPLSCFKITTPEINSAKKI